MHLLLEAYIPLVDGVPLGTASHAREVPQYHLTETSRAIIDGASEAEGAATVTGLTLVDGFVGEFARGADHTAVS